MQHRNSAPTLQTNDSKIINLFLNSNHILVQVQWRRHVITQGTELDLRITKFNSSRKCQEFQYRTGDHRNPDRVLVCFNKTFIMCPPELDYMELTHYSLC